MQGRVPRSVLGTHVSPIEQKMLQVLHVPKAAGLGEEGVWDQAEPRLPNPQLYPLLHPIPVPNPRSAYLMDLLPAVLIGGPQLRMIVQEQLAAEGIAAPQGTVVQGCEAPAVLVVR